MKKLTCSYGTTVEVSMLEKNGEPIMLLDMNIKDYMIHVGHDTGTYKFPPNIVINDKLYINRDMKQQLIETLEDFIKTTYLQNSYTETNQRGFKNMKPKDIYGTTISIQESSNMDPALWFGPIVRNNEVLMWQDNKLTPFVYPSHNILINDRLHLKMPQAKKLKNMIATMWKNFDQASSKKES